MACVLLTGATGFVGGATALRLLRDDRVERLVLLARAASEAEARIRLARSISRFGVLSPRWNRVDVIAGDLTSVMLERALVDSVTHVIHAAACTSLRAIEEARRSNVAGTSAVAYQLQKGARLHRFLFVSTAFRCGVVNTRTVAEDDLPADDHLAEYTRSKLEAEANLQARVGFPLLVARPSVVIGHSRLGVGPSASLFWYYRALLKLG